MPYGKLTVITGCMFAGKTTTMLMEAEKIDAVLFKPAYDTRYSDTEVVTHDGECRVANVFSSFSDIAKVGELERPYCFDEVQFLDGERYDGDFVADVRTLLSHGIEVVVSGLDMDWQGKPFPVTANLTAMADEVIKLGSTCVVCGSIASKTGKKHGEATVELGANDLYEPKCNRHWTSI
jgi:thymidine kinase